MGKVVEERKESHFCPMHYSRESASGLAAGKVCATCSEEGRTRPSKRIERRVWVARGKGHAVQM